MVDSPRWVKQFPAAVLEAIDAARPDPRLPAQHPRSQAHLAAQAAMSTTLHEKIKAHVIRGIHDGTWLPGQRLPSERQLEHVVAAVMPTAEQAGILDMPASEPCLQLTRRTWSRDVPVTWVRCLNPASRYSLGSRFRPVADQ